MSPTMLVASKTQQLANLAHHLPSTTRASDYLSSQCVDFHYLALRQKHGTWGIAQLGLINWNGMRCLSLQNCNFGPVDMMCLMKASLLQLRTMYLSYNNLGSEGMEVLVSARLPELICLQLTQTQLDTLAAKHLGKGH